MSAFHIIGFILVLSVVFGVGLYSSKRVASAADFATGGNRSGPLLISGTIMGTLVGGTSTVGTAQLAFQYGLSAIWFNLGAGIACLILGLCFVHKLRRSSSTTLTELIAAEYGARTGKLAGILCAGGILVSILAQILSGVALMQSITSVSQNTALFLILLLMIFYVIFGGIQGTGMVGICKLVLLIAACIVSGMAVLLLSGGLGGLAADLSHALMGTPLGGLTCIGDAKALSAQYQNLLARGASKDLASGISLIVGVLSNQIYAQSVWSGRSDAAAKKGCIISAVVIPLLGIAGILVGIFMRAHYITAAEFQLLGGILPENALGVIDSTSHAFPEFLLRHLSGAVGMVLSGVMISTLLVTVVGAGAGLALGIATILHQDLYRHLHRSASPSTDLVVTRALIVLVMAIAGIITIRIPAAVINDFGFLSMGLRGAVIFFPLCGCLWCKGKVYPPLATASVLTGPVLVFFGKILFPSVDPLIVGLTGCAILMGTGWLVQRRRLKMPST